MDSKLVKTTECDEEDFLEAVFLAEDRLHQDGYNEGFKIGTNIGLSHGREAGRQKASQIGWEIGFYRGCVKAWMTVIKTEEDIEGRDRKLKALAGLTLLVDGFDIDDISKDDYWDKVTKIRAKFKQVASLLKISTEFVCKSAGSNLSF